MNKEKAENSLEKLKKNLLVKFFSSTSIIFGVLGVFGIFRFLSGDMGAGNTQERDWFWIFIIAFGLIALVSGILEFITLKNLARKYNVKIDWKHYWFGWGKDKIRKEK